MRLSAANLRLNLSLALIIGAGRAILGFVDAYCHAKQRRPESRPQVDLGAFFSASASLRRPGRKSVPAMREIRPDKPDTTEERADS